MANTKPSWSHKAGEKGRNRVRVFEERGGGVILAEFYEIAAETGPGGESGFRSATGIVRPPRSTPTIFASSSLHFS